MPNFTSFEALTQYIQEQINQSLETDVAEEMVKVVQDHVQTDVYVPYTPQTYQRTGQLKQDVTSEMSGDTLEIYDTRTENGRDIPQIIEYGKGYYTKNLDSIIGPRPFMEEAEHEILQSDLHTKAMKESLKRKGFIIE